MIISSFCVVFIFKSKFGGEKRTKKPSLVVLCNWHLCFPDMTRKIIHSLFCTMFYNLEKSWLLDLRPPSCFGNVNSLTYTRLKMDVLLCAKELAPHRLLVLMSP